MQRRDFLKLMLSSSLAGSAWLLDDSFRLSAAQASIAPKTLVVIFQRGGCDGLNVVVPYADMDYYRLRPGIAIAPAGQTNGALDLNGYFGLHPAMQSLHRLYQQQQVAVFPAVHYPQASLSHFDSQQFIESAALRSDLDGWLNRHLASSLNSTGMRGVGFGNELAQALRGNVVVSSLKDLANFDLGISDSEEMRLSSRLNTVYAQHPEDINPYAKLLKQTGQTLLRDLDLTRQIDPKAYRPANGAVYPVNLFGSQLQQTAQLIKQGVGLEVAAIDLGGWDTHSGQGGAAGPQANLLKVFADGIAALCADLGASMQNVLVLTMTEFGRTAEENGSGGTDHGNASAWFAVGGGVKGGIYGTWPGLAKEKLYLQRYLAHSVDFRDIFAEVLSKHLGNTALNQLIPNYTPQLRNFIA
ncbi:DUF1501 domain-containing protein [uncultured Thiothrix sp.]|uniref:DUF1501 domain-containing protein n=1 Tax=uncultured Thiothrix sp. TaxID=223185 RepID=UPI002611B30C|nr:DUF1501 domain-containing protein [uncultured Thiothrix sp.]